MANLLKVYKQSGGPNDDFLQAPPTAGDVLVGEASVQSLTNKGVAGVPQVLAAAGSAQGDAAQITAPSGSLVHATGADGAKGIKLPAAVAGLVVPIKNSDAANAVLKVYPATGDAVNAIAANSAISMAAKTSAIFYAVDATTWFTVPLLPS